MFINWIGVHNEKMSKITTYMTVMTGLMLLFYFGGLLSHCDDTANDLATECTSTTPNSALLTILLKPENLSSDLLDMNTVLILAIQGAAAAAIVIGSVFSGRPDLAIVAPAAILMFNLGWDFYAVFNIIRSSNPVLSVIFFVPVLFIFGLIILDWWRGRDT